MNKKKVIQQLGMERWKFMRKKSIDKRQENLLCGLFCELMRRKSEEWICWLPMMDVKRHGRKFEE